MSSVNGAVEGAAVSVAGFPKRWRTLGVSQLAAFIALLDVSIVNVALPSIERGLDVSAGTAQWVVSGRLDRHATGYRRYQAYCIPASRHPRLRLATTKTGPRTGTVAVGRHVTTRGPHS